MNLSVKEAAELLAVSEKTIYRWIRQHIVPAYKVQGCYRFNRAELVEWATSRRTGIAIDAFREPESEEQPLPSVSAALEAGGILYRIEGQSLQAVIANSVEQLRLSDEVDRAYLAQVLIAREGLASTAVGCGIAIPHPRSPGLFNVPRSSITACFLENPVEFGALDGQPVRVMFLLLAPGLRQHLHLLAKLAFVLRDPAFRAVIDGQGGREEIFATLKDAEARIDSLRPPAAGDLNH